MTWPVWTIIAWFAASLIFTAGYVIGALFTYRKLEEEIVVCEWGPHTSSYVRESHPSELMAEIDALFGPHPAVSIQYESRWHQPRAIDRLADALRDGGAAPGDDLPVAARSVPRPRILPGGHDRGTLGRRGVRARPARRDSARVRLDGGSGRDTIVRRVSSVGRRGRRNSEHGLRRHGTRRVRPPRLERRIERRCVDRFAP
jgi:hypothetical protein